MRPKKSLGQNFLHSTAAREAIIQTARLRGNATEDSPPDIGQTVLEIGPGKGFLTERLLEAVGKTGKVVAVEKDDALLAFLQEKFAEAIKTSQLELIHGDILEFNPQNLGRYKLIANIPYYLTGEIIRQFLESANPPEMMVLMLQKEVAERIVAKDSRESILSISVKAFGEPKYIQTVKAGSFFPVPKVDSAILAINNIKPLADSRAFFGIVKTGFAHKRKLLRGNLACSTEVLEKCKIEPQARAENLNLNQWLCLTNTLPNHSANGKLSA